MANNNISGFTGFLNDEQDPSFFDQTQVAGNLNSSEMNFTMEEHESQGIGPRDLGMQDSVISDIDDN
jgi:hypothetical protein